jgi:2,4-dienoyl-CoA reductase-like NADH-dependent reductase (Old Yellow Enzyme family)
MVSILFTPFKIGNLEIKNRFVRSATVDNWGHDQKVTEKQVEFYTQIARGDCGLIISSGLFPSLDGWAAPGQLGIHQDDMIPSLNRLVNAVHANGGHIAAQLMHAGWFGNPALSGCCNVGPSSMVNPENKLPVRALTGEEVYDHIEQFAQAGKRAMEAGFDSVQVHAAHGWLVSAFLSPVTNHREDEFGGSPEKRAAFLLKIIQALRRTIGPDFPILVKLGLLDYHPAGKPIIEGLQTAVAVVKAGVDAVEVSEGLEEIPFHHIRPKGVKPYYLDECRQLKSIIDKPVILVGGMRRLSDIQNVVENGMADAVSMCRPFIMDQHIVRKLQDGTLKGSRCVSCNKCLPLMHKGQLQCIYNKTVKDWGDMANEEFGF